MQLTLLLRGIMIPYEMADTLERDLIKIRDGRDASFFDLTSIDQLTDDDLKLIFTLTRKFKEGKTTKVSLCKGRSQVNVFFEPSTRTQASFDLAAKNLSMDTTNVGGIASSTKKGESFLDTAETLSAYSVRTIILRSSQAGLPHMLAKHVKASIVNAGDGAHEHPTQGLLDAYTMLEHFRSKNLAGRVVTVVGDIKHSRVFGSLVRIMPKLGAAVRVAAPQTLLPDYVENFGVKRFYNIEEALRGADVVYALRVQEERGGAGYIPTLREYSKTFGISEKRLNFTKKDAILMHPGPVIRDIDVHSALVTRHPKSRILEQVENGMAVRKAVLWLLAVRYDNEMKKYKKL